MKLFAGSASVDLAKAIGKVANLPVSPLDQHIFPDGERRIRIPENVVDESVAIVQSAYPPVDTNYMELFLSLDAVKRSGAEFVTAVVPYFGYQRQDHIFRDGEAVSLEVVIRILESLGIDRLISVDMHSSRIPSLFHIPVTHASALPLFAETIQSLCHPEQSEGSTILISPDTGGIGRVKKLLEYLPSMEYAVLAKDRDENTGVVHIQGISEGSLGKKKRAIIIDDMISSGKTSILAAEFLKGKGIKEVILMATHPIFSEDAPILLQKSGIEKIYVTNTVPVPKEKQFDKLVILSMGELLSKAIAER